MRHVTVFAQFGTKTDHDLLPLFRGPSLWREQVYIVTNCQRAGMHCMLGLLMKAARNWTTLIFDTAYCTMYAHH